MNISIVFQTLMTKLVMTIYFDDRICVALHCVCLDVKVLS